MAFLKAIRRALPRAKLMEDVVEEPEEDPNRVSGSVPFPEGNPPRPPRSVPPPPDEKDAAPEATEPKRTLKLPTTDPSPESEEAPESPPVEEPVSPSGEGQADDAPAASADDSLLSLFTEEEGPVNEELHNLAMTLEEVDIRSLASDCQAIAAALRRSLSGSRT